VNEQEWEVGYVGLHKFFACAMCDYVHHIGLDIQLLHTEADGYKTITH
jgi:hypothetical protein